MSVLLGFLDQTRNVLVGVRAAIDRAEIVTAYERYYATSSFVTVFREPRAPFGYVARRYVRTVRTWHDAGHARA